MKKGGTYDDQEGNQENGSDLQMQKFLLII